MNVYAQCRSCGDWTYIIGTEENYGRATNKTYCEHCGSHQLDPQSTISERTFDVDRARKKSNRIKKQLGTKL